MSYVEDNIFVLKYADVIKVSIILALPEKLHALIRRKKLKQDQNSKQFNNFSAKYIKISKILKFEMYL